MEYTRINFDTIDDAVELLSVIHSMGAYASMAFEAEWAKEQLTAAIGQPHYFSRMAYEDGKAVGLFGGALKHGWLNSQLIAEEQALYVHKDTLLRTSIAAHMVRDFISWAKMNNVAYIIAADSLGAESRGVAAFYKQLGFKDAGRMFHLKGSAV
jgi:GNAT superfamily N-acetyltransferase